MKTTKDNCSGNSKSFIAIILSLLLSIQIIAPTVVFAEGNPFEEAYQKGNLNIIPSSRVRGAYQLDVGNSFRLNGFKITLLNDNKDYTLDQFVSYGGTVTIDGKDSYGDAVRNVYESSKQPIILTYKDKSTKLVNAVNIKGLDSFNTSPSADAAIQNNQKYIKGNNNSDNNANNNKQDNNGIYNNQNGFDNSNNVSEPEDNRNYDPADIDDNGIRTTRRSDSNAVIKDNKDVGDISNIKNQDLSKFIGGYIKEVTTAGVKRDYKNGDTVSTKGMCARVASKDGVLSPWICDENLSKVGTKPEPATIKGPTQIYLQDSNGRKIDILPIIPIDDPLNKDGKLEKDRKIGTRNLLTNNRTSGNLFVYTPPVKVVYKVGEKVSWKGMKLYSSGLIINNNSEADANGIYQNIERMTERALDNTSVAYAKPKTINDKLEVGDAVWSFNKNKDNASQEIVVVDGNYKNGTKLDIKNDIKNIDSLEKLLGLKKGQLNEYLKMEIEVPLGHKVTKKDFLKKPLPKPLDISVRNMVDTSTPGSKECKLLLTYGESPAKNVYAIVHVLDKDGKRVDSVPVESIQPRISDEKIKNAKKPEDLLDKETLDKLKAKGLTPKLSNLLDKAGNIIGKKITFTDEKGRKIMTQTFSFEDKNNVEKSNKPKEENKDQNNKDQNNKDQNKEENKQKDQQNGQEQNKDNKDSQGKDQDKQEGQSNGKQTDQNQDKKDGQGKEEGKGKEEGQGKQENQNKQDQNTGKDQGKQEQNPGKEQGKSEQPKENSKDQDQPKENNKDQSSKDQEQPKENKDQPKENKDQSSKDKEQPKENSKDQEQPKDSKDQEQPKENKEQPKDSKNQEQPKENKEQPKENGKEQSDGKGQKNNPNKPVPKIEKPYEDNEPKNKTRVKIQLIDKNGNNVELAGIDVSAGGVKATTNSNGNKTFPLDKSGRVECTISEDFPKPYKLDDSISKTVDANSNEETVVGFTVVRTDGEETPKENTPSENDPNVKENNRVKSKVDQIKSFEENKENKNDVNKDMLKDIQDAVDEYNKSPKTLEDTKKLNEKIDKAVEKASKKGKSGTNTDKSDNGKDLSEDSKKAVNNFLKKLTESVGKPKIEENNSDRNENKNKKKQSDEQKTTVKDKDEEKEDKNERKDDKKESKGKEKHVRPNLDFDEIKMSLNSKDMLKYKDGAPVTGGAWSQLDVPPTVHNGRFYIPVRAIAETLGCEVDWDGNTRTVTIKDGDRVVKINTETSKWEDNMGRFGTLDPKCMIKNVPGTSGGRTMIPIRSLSDILNLEVSEDPKNKDADVIYDNETKSLTIRNRKINDKSVSEKRTKYNNLDRLRKSTGLEETYKNVDELKAALPKGCKSNAYSGSRMKIDCEDASFYYHNKGDGKMIFGDASGEIMAE